MVSEKSVTARLAALALIVVLGGTAAIAGRLTPKVYYVSAAFGNDNNRGLRLETAFATIQKGIDTALDGDVVRVYPGLYEEEVDFLGKAIVVQGIAEGSAGVPVLQNPGDFAVSIYRGEIRNSVLSNFVIRNSFMGVFIAGSSPTLSNLTIVDNRYGIEAYSGSEPEINSTIFWNNAGGDLFGCQARYSCVYGDQEGEGNIAGDPLLVDPNAGDYHLFSERGRYWPEHDVWVLDTVTSPCIDAGDPNTDPMNEPVPDGGRINIGAYGGTEQASLSPSPQPELLPGQASEPNPADGAVDVEIDALLSWTAGANTVTHHVYFGTELSPPLVSNQTTTEFHPGYLDGSTTYFWRIDEVNSNGKTIGALWNFRTTHGGKGRTCFTGETGVWVDGALVPISSVNVGGCVGRMNENSLLDSGRIRELQGHEGVFECYDIILESGNCVSVAENHFFLTESGQWIALQNLRTGTRLQTPRGSIGILKITKRSMPYIGKVYNLMIEGSDRYLVGKDAIIVRDY